MDGQEWTLPAENRTRLEYIYFTGEEDSCKYGVGFLVHKDTSQTGICTDTWTQEKQGRQLQSVIPGISCGQLEIFVS